MANWKEAIDDNLQWHDFLNPVGMAAYTIGKFRDPLGKKALSEANTSALAMDREWAETQAQKQMDFQREMSNTSWQRAVEDMKAAGLNPALAYMQGGASSAVGAQAQTSSTDQKASLQRERLIFGLANSAIQMAGKSVGATRNTYLVAK